MRSTSKKMSNRFCFIACVKDESAIIERCLLNISNIATSYLICDTGSTDGTPEIITNFMASKNIPGQVIYKDWVDYGFNKSYLLEEARKTDAQYLIWCDADEVFLTDLKDKTSYLTKEDADQFYQYLESQRNPITYVMTHYNTLVYRRWNIARNNQLYYWKYPKHEVFLGKNDNSSNFYDKFILFTDGGGKAHFDPERSKKDVNLYLNWLNTEGNDPNDARMTFYLAQEYEYVDREKAIEWHLKRTKLFNGFDQEIYISYLRLGRLSEKPEDKIKYWTAGFNFCKARLECAYELVNLYDKLKRYEDGIEIIKQCNVNLKVSTNWLFVEKDKYQYRYALYAFLNIYFYINNNLTSAKNAELFKLIEPINQFLLKQEDLPEDKLTLIKNNAGFLVKLKEKVIETCLKEVNGKLSSDKASTEKVDFVSVISNNETKTSLINNNSIFNRFHNDIRPSIIIIDNFYPNPDEIRKKVLEEEFNITGNFPGGRTKSFATESDKLRFETIIGKKITYWPDGYNGAWQYTTSEKRSWIHRDLTDYSGIVYLSPNAPFDAGTIIYNHKETGLSEVFNKDDDTKLNKDSRNFENWDIVDVVGNRYNRLILFNGRMSHMSNKYFGNDKYDGRLFQTFFFNTVK